MSGQILPLDLLLKYELAKKLVLNKISDAFGGRLRFAISAERLFPKTSLSSFTLREF